MGHTQWMPEVWLNVGLDYDGDGRVSPFGKPDDGLAGTAQYLVKRGKYRAGEHWGYEVRSVGHAGREGASRTYDAWQRAGVTRADGKPFPQLGASARLWTPVPGGPAFLLGPNFYAVRSYNPSMNYTLSIVHLGDRIMRITANATPAIATAKRTFCRRSCSHASRAPEIMSARTVGSRKLVTSSSSTARPARMRASNSGISA